MSAGFCSRCGSQASEGQHFCAACGAPLAGGDGVAGPDGADLRGKRRWLVVTSAAAALVAVGALIGALSLSLAERRDASPEAPQLSSPETSPDELTPAEPVPPSPEELENDSAGGLRAHELAERFGDAVWRVEAEGCGVTVTGTAFAIGAQHLVTNHHVVAVDPQPTLIGRDGARQQGQVTGWRAQPDVAVIRVDEPMSVALDWAPTDELREGETLVTLGYPVPDTDFTVTPGTILSFQLDEGQRHAVRSDAALDKGNSGGPSLDDRGRVAGMVTEMADNRAGFQLVPLIFTADALKPSIEALREAARPPSRPDCAGAGVPNTLPEDWDAQAVPRDSGTYGDNPYLDDLWDACAAGDMFACDALFLDSPYNSEYERFGDTCGQRNEPAGWCVVIHGDRAHTGREAPWQLPSGLFCRDLEELGYAYAEAVEYWYLERTPDRMDASRNGIPCQTVYPSQEVNAFWGITDAAVLPSELFCRDLYAWGYTYTEAVTYWEREGRPDRMDASRNGIPCETVYPRAEIDAYHRR